jgi:actin-related protein
VSLPGNKTQHGCPPLTWNLHRYMLIDSRPRRMICVLPSGLSLPILSATLDTLFNRFMSPTIALLSIPVAVAVGAGVRSAIIIDLGWSETVVTSVYEYREVRTDRSVRAGRMLTEQTHKLLASCLAQSQQRSSTEPEDTKHVLSFEECNEIASRVVWCKPSQHFASANSENGLPTVEEQDESEARTHPQDGGHAVTNIPLRSGATPVSLELSFDRLAEPCENTFFDSQYSPRSFDDHELPLHLLVYRSLLELPLDVRAVCMSRIIFTGGCANVLGLRKRIFNDVSHLIREKGWDPVQVKSLDKLGTASRLKKRGSRQGNSGPTTVQPDGAGGEEQDGVWHDAANTVPEADPVEEQLKRGRDRKEQLQVRGKMRAVESLGAWSGASLITQLKAPAIATIDRDVWQQQGAAGASRAGDVDTRSQRQSVGPAVRGATSGSSWTLGVWGVA